MSGRVGLLEAVDDRHLLGAGLTLWPKQRELLAALEAGPGLHVWALGRRSGKTLTGAAAGVHNALLRPDLDALVRPGERRYVVAVANSVRQARLFVAAALSVADASPLLRGQIEAATLDELTFRNGVTIAAFPCSSRGGRGWPISLLFLDEFAHHVDSEGNSAAESVWTALSPSVAQFGDAGRVVAASTPFGSDGLFASLFERVGRGELEGVAQHATSAEANPTLNAAWLEGQRLLLGEEEFASEYLADFVSGGGRFFEPGLLAGATAARGELPPSAGFSWVAGLDPAFSSDPFGLAIVGRSIEDPGRLVLGLVRRWLPERKPGSLEEGRKVEDRVLAEVAAECRRYSARGLSDQYKAAGVVDRLRRLGVSVSAVPMTAASKSNVFRELRARLVAGELELYDESALLSELRRVRTRFVAGRASVEIPRVGGSHGDLAQALALSAWAFRGRLGARSGAAAGDAGSAGSSRSERYSTPGGRVERSLLEPEPPLPYGTTL